VLPDHIFIGGGNAKKLDPDTIGANRTIVPNISGLLGGIALWERTGDATTTPIAHDHDTESAPARAGA
jgi:polyphosphate glucokinase